MSGATTPVAARSPTPPAAPPTSPAPVGGSPKPAAAVAYPTSGKPPPAPKGAPTGPAPGAKLPPGTTPVATLQAQNTGATPAGIDRLDKLTFDLARTNTALEAVKKEEDDLKNQIEQFKAARTTYDELDRLRPTGAELKEYQNLANAYYAAYYVREDQAKDLLVDQTTIKTLLDNFLATHPKSGIYDETINNAVPQLPIYRPDRAGDGSLRTMDGDAKYNHNPEGCTPVTHAAGEAALKTLNGRAAKLQQYHAQLDQAIVWYNKEISAQQKATPQPAIR